MITRIMNTNNWLLKKSMPNYMWVRLNCASLVLFLIGMLALPLPLTAQQNQQSFKETDIRLLQVRASSVDWGDFNNDGNLDVVIAGRIDPDNKRTIIYQNNGNGNFSPLNANLEGISEGDVRWGDFDGDNDLDLVAIGWNEIENPTATIYENDNGTFAPISAGLQGVSYGSADWGDYDGDNDLDLIITGAQNGLQASTILYQNQENGTFEPVDANLMGVWKGSAEWGDFDADGDQDLVITGRDREDFPIAVIYENDGSGSFTQVKADLMGAFGGSSSDWGDYDNDDDLDLLISGWNANIAPATVVYQNQGDGNFSSVDARLMGVNDGMARWIDYDNNNNLDIMITGANARQEAVTRVYQNKPDTSFVLTRITFEGTWRSSFSWGDYNNDGFQDVVISGADYYNERVTKIYRNVLGQSPDSNR